MSDIKKEDLDQEDEVVSLFDDTDAKQPEDVNMEGAVTFYNDGRKPEDYVKPDTEPKVAQPDKVVEPSLPEKYRNKSVEDLIEMHRNAEKEFHRNKNELDKLRNSMVTQDSQRVDQVQVKEKELSVDDLLDNPSEVIRNAIKNDPSLREIREDLLNQQRSGKQKEFFTKYPDAMDRVQTEDFQDWIKSSDTRLSLFNHAHSNYDYDVAGELLDLYDAIHGVKQAELEKSRETAKKSISSPEAGVGQPKTTSRKVYREDQVLKLMMSNPDEYNRLMAGDLGLAFQEGRVR